MVTISLTSFLFNALLTPLILRLAHRYQWFDHRDHRKIHTEDTPRLGGVGIFLSALVVTIVATRLAGHTVSAGPLNPARAISGSLVVVGVVLIHLMGLYDDFVNLRAPLKFAVQIMAALLVAAGGLAITALRLPWVGVVTLPAAAGVALTVFWLVAISNALNLIDGADGLSGGIAASSAFFMGVLAYSRGNTHAAIAAFALVGALSGFLLYNMPPARIFMGDSGSLSVGFVLAMIPLIGLNGEVAAVAVIPVLTLLFLPIIDTVLAMARRIRRGQPIHAADREHIHHRVMDRGFGGSKLLLVAYSANVVLGLVALAWYALPESTATILAFSVWTTYWLALVLMRRRD